jgi:4-amino-4-deoxy-L-arabinose transferase-like glycosyltransferase
VAAWVGVGEAPLWKLERALAAAAVGVAAVYIGGFLVAAYFRLTFVYPMGVAESESVQAVRQIASGRALYGPPTLEFAAPIYTPLYFYLAALLGKVLSVGLPALRLVSLLASVGSALVIAYFVWRETSNRLASVGAAALFIGSTHLASTALDLARTDALSVFWLLAAIACAHAADRQHRTLALTAATGVLAAAAILTKQTTAVLALGLLLHALLSGGVRRGLTFSLATLTILGLAAVVLVTTMGTWPWVYLVELPRGHTFDTRFIASFWSSDILPSFGLPLALGVFFLVSRARRADWQAVRFWTILPISMLALAWISRINVASSSNVVLPAYAILAAWFGLGIGEAARLVARSRRYAAAIPALVLLALLIVQYNPRQGSPLRSDTWAAERLVATIANLPGSVYSPLYAEYVHQAGKGDNAFATSLMEPMGSFGGGIKPAGTEWMALYTQALQDRRFDELLLDPDYPTFLVQAARDNGYVDTGPLFGDDDIINQWQSPYIQMPHVWAPHERVSP